MFQRSFWLCWIALCLCINTSVQAAADSGLIREEQQFVDTLVAGLQKAQEPDVLWPGFSPLSSPLVLYFDSGRIYAVSLEGETKGWESYNGLESKLPILYTTQDRWGVTKGLVQTNLPLNNQLAFVMKIPSEQFKARKRQQVLTELVAERFKQFMGENPAWHDPSMEAADHDPWHQVRPKRIAMMRLARVQLQEYVYSGDINHLINYMSLAREIRNTLSDKDERMQNDVILREGVADYVAYAVNDVFFPGNSVRDQVLLALESDAAEDNIVRWVNNLRYHGMGSALAYALERLNIPDWKTRLPDQGFQAMLDEALPIPLEEQRSRAQALLDSSQFLAMVAEANDAIADYEQSVDTVTMDFDRQTGLRVIFSPGNVPVVQEGSAEATYDLLSNNNTLQHQFSGMLRTADNQTKIGFKARSILRNPEGEYLFYVGDEKLSLLINTQRPMTVTEDIRIARPFTSIEWQTDTTKGKIVHKGMMSIEGGIISIQLSAN